MHRDYSLLSTNNLIKSEHLQGNRILIGRGENFQEVIFLQNNLELLGMNTAFGSFLLFEQVQSNVAKYRKIFGSLIFTYSTTVFIQSDIQNPV